MLCFLDCCFVVLALAYPFAGICLGDSTKENVLADYGLTFDRTYSTRMQRLFVRKRTDSLCFFENSACIDPIKSNSMSFKTSLLFSFWGMLGTNVNSRVHGALQPDSIAS